ncbi:MAG: hypothetical protein R3220_06820 [Balneolaceae bacterium]|nr:hypothetical protein [Balneolaceae bacterium]
MKRKNEHSRPVWLLLIGIAFFFISCGDKNPTGNDKNPPEVTNPNTVSLDIGANGGSVTSKDGLVTLIFPEGALAGTETITITPIEQDDLGSEFDEVINEFGFGKAYELGPDGLSFEKPVEVIFQSDQVVTQQGDSVSISLELLFTNEGGGVAALDSLRMSVDEETGETTVTSELHHFSTLLIIENINNVKYGVEPIPTLLNVNSSVEIVAAIAQFDTDQAFIKPLKKATYNDFSSQPLQRSFNPAEQPLDEVLETYNRGFFEYSCIDKGTGIYKSEASGLIEKNDDGIIYPVLIDGLIVQKKVRCVAPPELLSPSDGSMNVELNILLAWNPVEGADHYKVQIAEEGKEFSEAAEILVSGPDAQLSGLKPKTTYRWRVRAVFGDFETDWSEVWSFTTAEGASLGFGSRTECITEYHGDWYFVVQWSVDLYGINNNDYGNVYVYMNVELPDAGDKQVVKSTGSDSQVKNPLYSPSILYMSHIINGTGKYKFDVDKVEYNDEEIDFSGETTSGAIQVTDDDLKGEGDC